VFRYSAVGAGSVSVLLRLLGVGVEHQRPCRVGVVRESPRRRSAVQLLELVAIWWRGLTAAGARQRHVACSAAAPLSLGISESRTSLGASGWPSARWLTYTRGLVGAAGRRHDVRVPR
jgi:hypothetical protein